MKEEDLRLVASLVDWSDKLMAKVFYETYVKVIQEKFAEYEELRNKLKEWIQQNYGNSKVPKTPRRMNPATKLLQQIQQFRVLNFDSDDEDDLYVENKPKLHLNRIPSQILKQLENIDLQNIGTTSSSSLKFNDNETPKLTNIGQKYNTISSLGHFKKLNKNFEQNDEANCENHNVYDYPGNNINDKTPKLRKFKTLNNGNEQKKILETYKKEEKIRRLEEKANLALKHREEILKDKAERAKRDREERQRRVEENNRLKEVQLHEREKQQRLQDERFRKFRLEQEETDKTTRSPAAKTRKLGTPRATRPPNNTLSKNTITSSVTSLQSAPSQLVNNNNNNNMNNMNINFIASSNTNFATVSTYTLHEFNETAEENFNNELNQNIQEEKEEEKLNSEKKTENNSNILVGENFDINLSKQNNNENIINSLPINNNNNENNSQVETTIIKSNSVNELMETDSPHFRPADEAEFLNKSTKSVPISSENTLQTPQTHLINSTKQKHVSYEITPDKIFLPSTKDNYVIDDLSSADETDNEEAPKKDIPKWAQKPNLIRKIAAQRQLLTDEQRENHFGQIKQPNVNDFFGKYCREYPLRSSSALWNSPMSNPTPGVGRYIR